MATNEKKADFHAKQLVKWQKENEGKQAKAVNSFGCPVPTLTKSLTAGPRGPILLTDSTLILRLSHFARERIPERVVHAKGAGAYGHFEVTHDISQYCKAKVFDTVGKKVPIFARFSTVGGEMGSADTVRDPRGFAVKFYTEDGNWDLVGNNTPVFFIQDPMLFPSLVHSQKRNPVTHLKDADMFWDFLSLCPESTHQVSFLFSDRGIPDGYRHMNGYGSHTFKLVNKDGHPVYCKFHMKCDQPIKNLMVEEARRLTADNPDYSIQDLYNAIAGGTFPSWTLHIQVMTMEEAENFKWNPFDLTKVWPHSLHPLIPVGKLVLDRNPTNFFNEVEQVAMSPANFVPGIESSPDKMLQGRIFAYADAQRYRLGINYSKLAINCPLKSIHMNTYNFDGTMNLDHETGPNYFPNSFGGSQTDETIHHCPYQTTGNVDRYDTEDDHFTQVNTFWTKVLSPEERQRLASNIGQHLQNVNPQIQERAIQNFTNVSSDFGKMIKDELSKTKGG